MSISIIGAGNMGAAIAQVALAAGTAVQVLTRDGSAADVDPRVTTAAVGDELTGDVVVLALPYAALAEVAQAYGSRLDGKVVVDITNPVDFATFDSLVVPAGTSAAEELARLLPGAHVVKAFNTTFAATLVSGAVGPLPTTVLVAGDDETAVKTVVEAFSGGDVRVVPVGPLRRARELEALGFLQLTLAASSTTSWTTGFALAE